MVVLEATTQIVLAVLNSTNRNKLVVLQAGPIATDTTITFDQSTLGLGITGFSKIVSAHAYDASTGMPKAISHNGSTILTTVGFTPGDNPWHVWVVLLNDGGGGV